MTLLRLKPGRDSYGYTSITSRLPAEVLQQAAGVKLVGVPYRSGPAALPDLLSGQIQLLFTDFSAAPHATAGRLRPIAVTELERSPLAPELPTFAAAGMPQMDIGFWLAAYLPARAAPAVVVHLQAQLLQALLSREVQGRSSPSAPPLSRCRPRRWPNTRRACSGAGDASCARRHRSRVGRCLPASWPAYQYKPDGSVQSNRLHCESNSDTRIPGAQALPETSMDVQTVWVAVRALGVATGLLVHPSAPQSPRAPGAAKATEIGAEHWQHVPDAISMDQVLAAFGR